MGRKLTITIDQDDVPTLLDVVEDYAELGCCGEPDCEECNDVRARCQRIADHLLRLAPPVEVG